MLDALAEFADFGVQFASQASGGFNRLPEFCFELSDSRARFGLLAGQLILELNHARYAFLKLRVQYFDVLLALTQHVGRSRHPGEPGNGGLRRVA